MSFDRLVTFFETRQNVLVKPEKWDDPFENYILRKANRLLIKNGLAHLNPRGHLNFFGQCWTLLEESDAMWRIYSPNKDGVKVMTTVRKLFNSISKLSDDTKGTAFIGKVAYWESDHLKRELEDDSWVMSEYTSPESRAISLLIKRIEFAHEKEVRLLFEAWYHNQTGIFSYGIDPIDLIDEIQFDPRISDNNYKVFQSYLTQKLDFKKRISVSSLYKIPDLFE